MRNKRQKRAAPNLYINIAPLVEVMLVLIIIFMLATPALQVGVKVDLPKTKAASLNDSKTNPIVVSIDKKGDIYIEEAKVTIDELIQKLPLILANGKTDTIYVRGDKDLNYGTILEIMGVISSSGGCKVSLISHADASNNKIPAPKKKTTGKNVGRL